MMLKVLTVAVTLTLLILAYAQNSDGDIEISHNNDSGAQNSGGDIELSHNNDSGEGVENDEHEACDLAIASIDWDYVEDYVVIAVFLLFSAITKLGFHHAGFLVTKIPESCILILLGTIAGALFTYVSSKYIPEELQTLNPTTFFLVLLPPIILEASYSLHNRVFLDNIASILIFAVVGTLAAFVFIGPLLYFISAAGAVPVEDQLSFIHCMLFASIVVAVDPVAVLAIFEEVGVNNVLYFLVFGESLLNDAVTVVLYHTVEGISCYIENGEKITPILYAIAVGKFFATSFGGISVGIIFGVITSLLTKYTVETRVVEPLLLFSLAYLSYVISELFHFSGIISMTVCGLLQAQYAFHNISHKSYVTVKYFTKMASSASDSVIFLYLGMNLIRTDHVFHPWFILVAVLLTLVSRFIIVYGLSAIVNTKRTRQITKREQFIMAYGGLRGAVAFSLVALLTGKLDHKIQNLFMTTILVVIIFTVFIQGATIKPLVSLLDIRTKDKEHKLVLFAELNANVTDHVMAGIEEIVGTHGQFFFYDWFIHLDDKYIKHKLQRNPLRKDEKIMQLYEKIALKQHFANLHGAEAAQNYVHRSLTVLKELPSRYGGEFASIPSIHPTVEPRRILRPSLLSQLTKFGYIEEPEHEEDLAYITPEMLEDDEMSSIQRRKLFRQQTIVSEELKNAEQLRQLLVRPASSMDTRELRTHVDMDDRSNLMYLLQEKNKRLERFKRSLSAVGYEGMVFPKTVSAMASIPEGSRQQIVKKAGLGGKQGSMMGAESHPSEVLPADLSSGKNKPVPRQADAPGNFNQNNPRCSVDSVFYRCPEDIELTYRPAERRRDTIDQVLESIQSASERDVEKGHATAQAGSSPQTERLKLLPTVTELPDKESCASLVRQAAVTDDSDSAELDSDDLEQGSLLKFRSSGSNEDVGEAVQ